MLVYPFDPQCRLDSNEIKDEPLLAYPSSATRTLVPAHAPFFQEGCVVKKNGKELVEGIDFYFSLEHKVASYATALRVYGGITIINDSIAPPLTMDYHLQGGSFEATPGQIRQYLDTAPDIWDGSWEALLGNSYYPPVKILYDPEKFVSEPALIEACNLITEAIKAKDEKETISYQVYAMRVAKLKADLDNLDMDEHVLKTGNVHNTKPSDVGALGKDELAANTRRLEGKDLAEFTAYVNSVIGDLAEAMANKVKVGEDLIVQEKFLLDGGTLELGEGASLTMDEDGISLIGDNAFTVKADSKCLRPGTKATMYGGGGNTLVVESSGNAKDDRKLFINDKEVVTLATLRAYVNSILAQTGYNFTQQQTSTMYFTGAGTMQSPIEAVPTIPVATETAHGVVKVVNEGSHGFPCPGYSNFQSYIYHIGGDDYMQLRNGADDLEHDVFFTKIKLNPYKLTPTADRFRPKGLPNTAKPTYIRYGTEDCVWLSTTDGEFILLTGKNPDPDTWRCLKIANAGIIMGTPHLYNNKIYIISSEVVPTYAACRLVEAPITAANTLTFSQRTLSGVNFNNTAVNGQVFNLFDKIAGAYGDPKCYWYNRGDGVGNISVSHAGDPVTQLRNGNVVRVLHMGNLYAPSPTREYRAHQPVSYLLNLDSGTVEPDNRECFPIEISKDGYSHSIPRHVLAGVAGNVVLYGLVANGRMFAYDTYGSFVPPWTNYIVPRNGVSLFEEMKAQNQYWTVIGSISKTGLYASPITTRPRGPRPLGGNRMLVECSNLVCVKFKYDPNGSYGPNTQGYGPTNERIEVSRDEATRIAKLCWTFDGDNILHEGAWFTDGMLTAYTSYENGEFGQEVSIDPAAFAALKSQAIDRFASDIKSIMVDSRLSLTIHRRREVVKLANLQVAYLADAATGRKEVMDYFFTINPSSVIGTVGSITIGTLLRANKMATTWGSFHLSNLFSKVCAHMYRLNDGGWVVAVGGWYEAFVGDHRAPWASFIFDAVGNMVGSQMAWSNPDISDSPFGTKELGYGMVYHTATAEGLYMDSWGHTTAELLASIGGTRATKRYIVVLSRSDAGDNVAISQYAASATRDKVQSLIPPARKVQNMDLTQDRTITRAMLANSDRVPNQRDSTYPVQQKHNDAVSSRSLKTHTHAPGDFTMAAATTADRGGSVLGDLSAASNVAVNVNVLSNLEDATDIMFQRPVVQVKLDASLAIDYEV